MSFTNAKIVGDGVPYAVYSEQKVVRGNPAFIMSRSELMNFVACPMKWKNGFENEDTKATEYGQLIDCLALVPSEFESRFSVEPALYTNEDGEKKPWNNNAKVCRAWNSEQVGKIVIKATKRAESTVAVKALMADSRIAALIHCSKKQVHVTADYKDRETGIVIPVRSLIDLVPGKDDEIFGKSIADLKTADSAAAFPWGRKVFSFGYDTQAALSLDIYVAATGEDRIEFRHVIQESCAPWQTGRRIVSQEFVELGRAKYLNALKYYAHCLKENSWPDYDTHGRMVLDGWQLTEPEPWMVSRVSDSTSLPYIAPITTALADVRV